MKEPLLYLIALTKLKGIGLPTANLLVNRFGSAQNLFEQDLASVELPKEINKTMLQALLNKKEDAIEKAKMELELLDQNNIVVVDRKSENYPVRLSQCPDAPLLLYTKGEFKFNQPKVISIVGTRKATSYGKRICNELIESLAHHNPLVVSGLAYGVDVAAHKSAMKNNLETIAVLGHGLSSIHPTQHTEVAKEMCESGGLVTEFAFYTRGSLGTFPKRNRIVAGLSDITIVIESSEKGGSLITARLAQEYNREVVAVPGSIGQPQSKGCNWLIKTNRAALIDSAEDIEQLMGWKSSEPSTRPTLHLSKEQQQIVEYLIKHKEATVDEIAKALLFTMNQLSSLLLELEFMGAVQSMPGKRFSTA